MSQKTILVSAAGKAFYLFVALGICFGLGVGFYFGVSELRYSLYGSTTLATINHESYEWRREGGHRRGSGGLKTRIATLDYSFQEESGLARREYAEIDCRFLAIERDKTVLVQYIPGVRNASRVKRSVYSYAQSFLFDILLFSGALIIVAALCGVWDILQSVWTRAKPYVRAGG